MDAFVDDGHLGKGEFRICDDDTVGRDPVHDDRTVELEDRRYGMFRGGLDDIDKAGHVKTVLLIENHLTEFSDAPNAIVLVGNGSSRCDGESNRIVSPSNRNLVPVLVDSGDSVAFNVDEMRHHGLARHAARCP